MQATVEAALAAQTKAASSATDAVALAEQQRDADIKEYDELIERRRQRAVGSYMAVGSLVEAKLQPDNTKTNIVVAIEELERRDGVRSRQLQAEIKQLGKAADDARGQAKASNSEVARLTEAQKILADKLNSVVDLTLPVPVGPSPVAQAAYTATAALDKIPAATVVGGDTLNNANAQLRGTLTTLATLVAPQPGFLDASNNPAATAPDTTTTIAPTTTTPADPAAIPAAPTTSTIPPAMVTISDPTVDALVNQWTTLDQRRLRVLLFALQQVGKPYVWAADGPDTFDCSGLTLRSWATVGVGLVHFSGTQTRSGPHMESTLMAPSDLMTYGPNGDHHVTMYLGGGRMVEAKGAAYGVVVSDARTSNLYAAVRIVI
jgi:cell wall-associated NlpC family hydrolase